MYKNINKKILRISILSMFSAIFYIIGKFLTINIFFNLKLTFKVFLLYIVSIIFGKFSGMFVGFIGELIIQLTSQYGLTPTTILWILPYIVVSFIFGKIYNKNIENNKIKLFLLLLISNLILTFLNTVAFFVDSKIFGYYNYLLIFGKLYIKMIIDIILAIIYTILFPYCRRVFNKITNQILQ